MAKEKKNPKNYIIVTYPQIEGDLRSGSHYVFQESNHRWQTLRNFVNKRTLLTKGMRFFLVTGVSGGQWDFGQSSHELFTTGIPLPEVIFDTQENKIYRFKAQLWEIK